MSGSDFFKPLRDGIRKTLATRPIIESCAGSMVIPSSLIYVPKEYIDDESEPFTLNASTENKYLSRKYSPDRWDEMDALGVTKLSLEGFLQDLHLTITKHGHDFQQRPDRWHSKLAEVLLPWAVKGERLSSIAKLKIIPLRDGSWISAQDRTIFFPEHTDGLDIPGGIKVFIVDAAAGSDSNRQALFLRLGVKSCNESETTQVILKTHADPSFNPELLSMAELISHAAFLYRAEWQNSNDSELWFVTEKEKRHRGSELYLDTNADARHSATKYFALHRSSYPFLHCDYLKAFPSESESWLLWLENNLHLSTLPRLVSPLAGSPFDLSDDFKFIIETWSSSEALLMLCDNWSHYSRWIEECGSGYPRPWSRKSKLKVRNALETTNVRCCDGIDYPSKETFLPSSGLLIDVSSHPPILDIPDISNQKWQNLGKLGVALNMNVRFYLLCLEQMQGCEAAVSQISYIYEQIQARCSENEELVRLEQFFRLYLYYKLTRL
jgi:hypothetical protein